MGLFSYKHLLVRESSLICFLLDYISELLIPWILIYLDQRECDEITPPRSPIQTKVFSKPT